MEKEILEKLTNIERMLEEQNLLKKEVLDFDEMCAYLEISKSHGYKLTSSKKIPYSCPNGKKLYFNRQKLDQWKQKNNVYSNDELEKEVENFLIKKGKLGFKRK